MRHWILPGLAFAIAASSVAATDYRATLQLEPQGVLGLDEIAVLSLKIEGGDGETNAVPEFQLENFHIASGPSRSTSILIDNGVPSSVLTLSWQLRPEGVGPARVYSASARVDGERMALPEHRLEILEQAAAGRQRQSAADDLLEALRSRGSDPPSPEVLSQAAGSRRRRSRPPTAPRIILRAEAIPAEPYVGQQVLYTLYLFTDVDVHSPQLKLPDFKGFWTREIPQPEDIEPEPVLDRGERVYRFVLLQRALFPRRHGRLEIPPAVATLEAMVRGSGRLRSLLPQAREIERTSNPVTVPVRQLPPPPPGFEGAVGELELHAALEPRELESGDAATLTLTLEGRGHLSGIAAPRLGELAGMRVFAPQQQSGETLVGKSVAGNRSWSYVLVPERPGEWLLPAVEIPYFDPRQGRYLTARTSPQELRVRHSTRMAHEAGQTVELHSIRTAALPLVAGSRRIWPGVQVWLFGLPWGLAVVALLIRRRRGPACRAPACRGPACRAPACRGPAANQAHHRLLRSLREAAAETRPRHSAARLEEAWRGFLEERWGITPGTPSTRWGQLLKAAGAAPASAEELVGLADDLHYLRYAPQLSSTEELRRELLERSRKIARRLR